MISVQVKHGDIDFRGYEIARTQFFTSASMISVTFSNRCIRFSSDCIRKFENTEYIDLLVHPYERVCIARPCSAEYRNKMRWAKLRNGKMYVREISGAAFLATLYDLFNWNPAYKYRLRGEIVQFDGECVVSFDISEPEIIIPCDITPTHDMYIIKQTKKASVILPQSCKDNFGDSYYSYISRSNIKLSGVPIFDNAEEYNTQPELNPTDSEKIVENMQDLFVKMQNKEELYGNSTIAEQ